MVFSIYGKVGIMSLVSMLKPRGESGFGYGSTAEEVTEGISLAGKNILITGSNSGLGFETMRVLALRGAHIYGAARTLDKAIAATARVQGQATGVECELSDPESILSCAEYFKSNGIRLDIVICNAGIMALPKLEHAFGYELQFFTNHIGHFMLVNRLTESLAENGRVVVLSSDAHKMAPREGIQFDNLDGKKGYKPWTAYGQSKLANLLFAKELSRRWSQTKRTANALHPGVIHTNLIRDVGPMTKVMNTAFRLSSPILWKTIPQGSATSCYVAVHPKAASLTGKYFSDCNLARPIPNAESLELAQRLWERSEKIVASFS